MLSIPGYAKSFDERNNEKQKNNIININNMIQNDSNTNAIQNNTIENKVVENNAIKNNIIQNNTIQKNEAPVQICEDDIFAKVFLTQLCSI